MNARTLPVATQASEGIHPPVPVGDFRIAEARVRGIESLSRVPAGGNGNLIVESFRAAKVSLCERRKNIVSHFVRVQRDHDPIHLTSCGSLAAVGGGSIARNVSDQRRDPWLKLPSLQGPARIEPVCEIHG